MSRGTTRGLEMIFAILAIALGTVPAAIAQRAPVYPARMAPIAEYLMPDRGAEVALARTAAPRAISSAATIMVLGQAGYQSAVEGSNGYVCLIERSWGSPFISHAFWNPKIRSPVCFNPAGARSILPVLYLRTRLALAGLSEEQILDSVKAAFATHAVESPEPGAMAFMLSKKQLVGDDAEQWLPHLMFELPKGVNTDWGANAPGSPVLARWDTLDPTLTEYMIPVGRWSDGTAAPQK